MSDSEMKELVKQLREELKTAECNIGGENETRRGFLVHSIVEAQDLAERIYRELDLREAEKLIRAA